MFLGAGPPLGLYEASLARARLAQARGFGDAGAIIQEVVRLARVGGRSMTQRLLMSP